MKLSPFALEELAPYITGARTGRELITLFNKHGFRDVYDEKGLPDTGKKNGQRPSRTEFSKARLRQLNDSPELRSLLSDIFNDGELDETEFGKLNAILNPEKFELLNSDGKVSIQGGAIDRRKPVVNEAHFQDIQNRILEALDGAKVSIRVVMAWFTNETLFNKLIDKRKQGVDVEVVLYDDGVNKKHGVDVTLLPHKKIKRGKRGGLMHDKFCVIDNQIVITGSYNWTTNAECRNDENITIEKDPELATQYSLEHRRLKG